MSSTSVASDRFFAPPLVALCGWLIPGSGYLLIGQKLRGLVIGVTILILFVLGILIAGIRVVDVPGYDKLGNSIYFESRRNSDGSVYEVKNTRGVGKWSMLAHPFPQIADKPWFVGQVLAGPVCLIAAHWSIDVSHAPPPVTTADIRSDSTTADAEAPSSSARPVPPSHARIFEIGTLYTAIAGMLNLLAIIDASHRAGQSAQKGS